MSNPTGLSSKQVPTGAWAWTEWLYGRAHSSMQLERLLEEQSLSCIKPATFCARGMWIDLVQEHEYLACSLQPHKPWLHSYLHEQWWVYSFQNSISATRIVNAATIAHMEEQEVKYNTNTKSIFSRQVLEGRWKRTQLQNVCIKNSSDMKDS